MKLDETTLPANPLPNYSADQDHSLTLTASVLYQMRLLQSFSIFFALKMFVLLKINFHALYSLEVF
jgi:hypothetical protein